MYATADLLAVELFITSMGGVHSGLLPPRHERRLVAAFLRRVRNIHVRNYHSEGIEHTQQTLTLPEEAPHWTKPLCRCQGLIN